MEIDHQAPFAGRKEIFIEASPRRIWKLQSDINGWSAWQTHIAASRIEDKLKAGTVFHWKARGLNITSTLQVVQVNKCIGFTGKAFGTQARHIFTFKPHKNGTLVIAEESLNGWLAKVMKIILPNYLEKSMDSSLKTLKSKAEGSRKRTAT
jgi:Polyketide cyclase / dehydrase and lipid transport